MTTDEQPVLDPAVLDQYTGGDPGLAREIYAAFLAQTRQDGAQLCSAFGSGRIADVAQVAHRVKSSSGMVGAMRQSLWAERIEETARAGDIEGVRAAMAGFEREHDAVLAALVGCDAATAGT